MSGQETPMRARRLERGLTQVQLSKMTGISQTRISHLETGKRFPNPPEVRLLTRALRCLESDLFAASSIEGGAKYSVRKKYVSPPTRSPRFRLID